MKLSPPPLPGVTFLIVIRCAVVDRGDASLGVIEDLGDDEAGDAEPGHVCRDGAPEVVAPEVDAADLANPVERLVGIG